MLVVKSLCPKMGYTFQPKYVPRWGIESSLKICTNISTKFDTTHIIEATANEVHGTGLTSEARREAGRVDEAEVVLVGVGLVSRANGGTEARPQPLWCENCVKIWENFGSQIFMSQVPRCGIESSLKWA